MSICELMKLNPILDLSAEQSEIIVEKESLENEKNHFCESTVQHIIAVD